MNITTPTNEMRAKIEAMIEEIIARPAQQDTTLKQLLTLAKSKQLELDL